MGQLTSLTRSASGCCPLCSADTTAGRSQSQGPADEVCAARATGERLSAAVCARTEGGHRPSSRLLLHYAPTLGNPSCGERVKNTHTTWLPVLSYGSILIFGGQCVCYRCEDGRCFPSVATLRRLRLLLAATLATCPLDMITHG